MEWTQEMREMVSELTAQYVRYGRGCDGACDRCPYAEQCQESEGWWECEAWARGMGDDL